MSKVVIITLGCKQNKYESDCMARILEEAGYEVSEKMSPADIYIINSCAVTAEGEKKSRQYISKCNALNPNCKIIVCGCAGENNIEQFAGKENVYSVFGTEGKENILRYINESIFENIEIPKKYCSINSPFKTTTRENLKIQDGCNNFCSYCLIPYLRGRSRSRDLQEIIDEANRMAERSREIVLTGIDISSYEINGEKALDKLMAELSKVPALISLGSLEVGVVDRGFMEVLKTMPNFSPHFHLSLQSGDDSVLKRMNRHYTAEQYFEKLKLIREYFPLANITTDVIVGFAGESEKEFNNTLEFVRKCEFAYVHIFPYSKRKGTRSYNLPDLPNDIKKYRVNTLDEVARTSREKFLKLFVGKESTLLVEEKKGGFYEGFSREYIRCYCNEDLQEGVYYNVKFERLYADGMIVSISN